MIAKLPSGRSSPTSPVLKNLSAVKHSWLKWLSFRNRSAKFFPIHVILEGLAGPVIFRHHGIRLHYDFSSERKVTVGDQTGHGRSRGTSGLGDRSWTIQVPGHPPVVSDEKKGGPGVNLYRCDTKSGTGITCP